MGVINYTTAKINELLDKIDKAPEKIENGKTPVFVTGTTTTLDPGLSATAEVVQDGVDENGNPKYKINFGVPKGLDGASGGGGGTADSVQWAKVLNKPSWVNSATKPTYTASEVGALPADTTIPSKTSQLTNDSNFLTSSDFKTINGESIVGSGNISLSGTGGISDAPKDGETYGRNNGLWVKTSQMEEAPTDDKVYARKNKGWTTVLEKTETALLDNYLKQDSYTAIEPTDSINSAIGKLEAGYDNLKNNQKEFYLLSGTNILNLNDSSTSEEILSAFGGDEGLSNLGSAIDDGKIICISAKSTLASRLYPVSAYKLLSIIYISFIDAQGNIYKFSLANGGSISCVVNGSIEVGFNGHLFSITSSSSSDEISTAVGGESGLKNKIIKATNGARFYDRFSLGSNILRVQLLTYVYSMPENGDLLLGLSGLGAGLWGTSLGGIIFIKYTKSTNEFEVEIVSFT